MLGKSPSTLTEASSPGVRSSPIDRIHRAVYTADHYLCQNAGRVGMPKLTGIDIICVWGVGTTLPAPTPHTLRHTSSSLARTSAAGCTGMLSCWHRVLLTLKALLQVDLEVDASRTSTSCTWSATPLCLSSRVGGAPPMRVAAQHRPQAPAQTARTPLPAARVTWLTPATAGGCKGRWMEATLTARFPKVCEQGSSMHWCANTTPAHEHT